MKASIRYDRHEGVIVVSTPYRARFVAALKEAIPYDFREWDSDAKVWLIDIEYQDELMPLLHHYYTVVEEGDEFTSTPAPAELGATLWLRPGAPPELVDASYRVLAKLHHPDRNHAPGSTETMKKINRAYEVLREVSA